MRVKFDDDIYHNILLIYKEVNNTDVHVIYPKERLFINFLPVTGREGDEIIVLSLNKDDRFRYLYKAQNSVWNLDIAVPGGVVHGEITKILDKI